MTRSTDLATLSRDAVIKTDFHGSTAVTVQNEAGTMTPGPLA